MGCGTSKPAPVVRTYHAGVLIKGDGAPVHDAPPASSQTAHIKHGLRFDEAPPLPGQTTPGGTPLPRTTPVELGQPQAAPEDIAGQLNELKAEVAGQREALDGLRTEMVGELRDRASQTRTPCAAEGGALLTTSFND